MTIAHYWRSGLLLLTGTAVIMAALFVDPIAQDPTYHQFADQRHILSIAKCLNVISNLPFAVIGAIGFVLVNRHSATFASAARPAWLIFFVAVFLTAFGSGYFHLNPNNATLIWDRLPMTIAFMSFGAVVVGEYLSLRAARAVLVPLLLVGAASVLFWAYTESLGRGDLRAYAVVQFLPVLLIPMVVLLYRDRSDLSPYIGSVIVCYIGAKLLEYFDAPIYATGQLISGHTLKHVFASLAPAIILYGLMRRRYHSARPHQSMD